MKTSRILMSVLYEPWMMLPEAADAYLPIVAAWLMGNEITIEEKGRLEIQMAVAGGVSPGYPEDIADFPNGSIAIVNLKGEMTKYDGMCSYGALSIGNLIKQLAMAKNIAGVVLDVDGPGGSVNAIPPLVEGIQFFKAQGKPIGVHADMIASAHYCVGCHGDFVMLDNAFASRAGSIGTMIQLPDYRKRLELMGVKIETIYATQSTHKNQESEQALDGKHELMKKNVLDPLTEKFQQTVRAQRMGKLDESIPGLLNGAMFFGEDSVKNGFADSIGTMGDAIQRVLDLSEIRKFMR